jgi:hypothetical protein
MRKITLLFCLVVLAPAFAVRARAQDSAKPAERGNVSETAKASEAPNHYYHLVFVVQEVGTDGKPTNSRTYSTVVCSGCQEQPGAIRTGNRIPIVTGVLPGTMGDEKLEYQYQYIDVGVNIDMRDVREIGHQLALHLKAEVTSLATETAETANSELAKDPVIRQNQWQASVIIPIGKPTVVFTSDTLDSKGGMQVVVTATPLP